MVTNIRIRVDLDYQLAQPGPAILVLEAAGADGQQLTRTKIDVGNVDHFARVPAEEGIGEKIIIRATDHIRCAYEATVAVTRTNVDIASLPAMELDEMPGDALRYLLPSRYCQAERFFPFVTQRFGDLTGGAGSVVGTAATATGSAIGGIAQGAGTAVGNAVQGVAQAAGAAVPADIDQGVLDYLNSSLMRPAVSGISQSDGALAAPGTPTMGDAELARQTGVVLGNVLRTGEISDDDKAFLVAAVARRTGQTEDEVTARVDQAVAAVQDTRAKAEQVAADAKAEAERLAAVAEVAAIAAAEVARYNPYRIPFDCCSTYCRRCRSDWRCSRRTPPR